MIKKVLNYFFILVAVTTTSFTISMEKEVPALSELATRPIVINLLNLFQEDLISYENPYLRKPVSSKFLSELKRLSQELPPELFLPIINFDLQIVRRGPKTFLLTVLNAVSEKNYKILMPILEGLLQLGADASITGQDKYSPLIAALKKLPETDESVSFLQMLVNSGANVNASYKTKFGNNETAIFVAAFKPKFLQFLIQAGADVNKGLLNNDGTIFMTPLDHLELNLKRQQLDTQTINKIQQSITILRNAGGKRNKDLIFERG